MKKIGLLGKTLGHSYSPFIHSMLGDYSYVLFEKRENELAQFIRSDEFDGLNVTIPYKKAIVPFLGALSDTAKKTGSVNTIVRKPDGTLYGDNTDVYGFKELLRLSGINMKGKKTLVLGSGGGSAAVCEALKMAQAEPVVISRNDPKNNYQSLSKNRDADIIVNTTPLGMYPENGNAAIDVSFFPKCKGVFDIIYNPSRTALLLSAEKHGIPCYNGLYMLAAQAKRSAELFTGSMIPREKIDIITNALEKSMKNIIIIGMPGSGKSLTASKLAELTGREAIDCDSLFYDRNGIKPAEYILKNGEDAFREAETKLLSDVSKLSGKIISTGGGAVTKRVNYDLMHQNGTIVWLKRDIEKLATEGRPLSQRVGVKEIYEKRRELYEKFADIETENDGTIADAAEKIYKAVLGD